MVVLCYADVADDAAANLRLVLAGVMIAAGVALVGAVPVWAAWRRKHPHLEVLAAAMLIWTITLAWSGISLVAARSDSAKEKLLRLESGYDSDPANSSAPQPPILLWSTLTSGWLLVSCWALLMPIGISAGTDPATHARRGTLQAPGASICNGRGRRAMSLLRAKTDESDRRGARSSIESQPLRSDYASLGCAFRVRVRSHGGAAVSRHGGVAPASQVGAGRGVEVAIGCAAPPGWTWW